MSAKITIVAFNCEICGEQQFLPPGHLKQSHTDFCHFDKQLKEASNDEQKELIKSNFLYKIAQKKAQLLNAVNTCKALEVQINMQALNQTEIFLENDDLFPRKEKTNTNGHDLAIKIQRCVKKRLHKEAFTSKCLYFII